MSAELVHITRAYEVWDVPPITVPGRWRGTRRFRPLDVRITRRDSDGWVEAEVSGPVLCRDDSLSRRVAGTFYGREVPGRTATEWPAWLRQLADEVAGARRG